MKKKKQQFERIKRTTKPNRQQNLTNHQHCESGGEARSEDDETKIETGVNSNANRNDNRQQTMKRTATTTTAIVMPHVKINFWSDNNKFHSLTQLYNKRCLSMMHAMDGWIIAMRAMRSKEVLAI